jgi:hypothetical protein
MPRKDKEVSLEPVSLEPVLRELKRCIKEVTAQYRTKPDPRTNHMIKALKGMHDIGEALCSLNRTELPFFIGEGPKEDAESTSE